MVNWEWRDSRYNRQEAIPSFGSIGQEKLGNSRVCVVGAGGVKSSLLLHLAAVGVGHIRVIDFDKVELSNLNRQILYGVSDIGKFKARSAAARLRDLNPDIDVEGCVARVDAS